ncbi:STAS/SEC14 domain-containing protein [Devosia rhodophyticola]|uniref:STAS/SEC14 domain-containing protein n=1 Tax=Devosia rhodophyticola TaxID=3026423 RepID=A0ABY7YX45_9HYPH|nr:STAS/SEC14 domain-containing protein [Devosia rhodophyticola]WDR05931.1 STAS/SEC14 domain-containing protein [Devosia rhodophyticola]
MIAGPENILATKLSGEAGLEDVKTFYEAIDSKLQANKTIGVVIDITEFEDASRDAVVADVKNEIGLLGKLGQFHRMALLTEKRWIAFLAEHLDPIVPSLKMKIFAPGQTQAAIEWARQS